MIAICVIVTMAAGFGLGVLFARPTERELASLEALARGDAKKAWGIYHKIESKF